MVSRSPCCAIAYYAIALFALAVLVAAAAASRAAAQVTPPDSSSRARSDSVDSHRAQPERPTVATHAGTVAPGWVEIEFGGQRSESGGAAPIVACLTGPTFNAYEWLLFDAGVSPTLRGPQQPYVYAGVTWNIGKL